MPDEAFSILPYCDMMMTHAAFVMDKEKEFGCSWADITEQVFQFTLFDYGFVQTMCM
jgi:hypothetical protein